MYHIGNSNTEDERDLSLLGLKLGTFIDIRKGGGGKEAGTMDT